MPKISIVTDTDSCMPVPLTQKHRILLVPISINFGEERNETDLTLSNKALFERIDKEGRLPTTAAPIHRQMNYTKKHQPFSNKLVYL